MLDAAQTSQSSIHGYTVAIDVFEGPLDLLLHLVKKHELDILDIPIAFVTEKYLEYINLMNSLSLDVAGEYLLMAATLAYIKSRELLPATDNDEEGDLGEEGDELDPRQELIRRLLEYQKYRDAAESLNGRPVVGRNVWPRGADQNEILGDLVHSDIQAPLAAVPVLKLIEALDKILAKVKTRASHEVQVEPVSVTDRMAELAVTLQRQREVSFSSCFRCLRETMTAADARQDAVVTFLAILEMAKLRLITVVQSVDSTYDEEIMIVRTSSEVRERLQQAFASRDEAPQPPLESNGE